MNLFVDKVIQRCAGLEPGDLANVIEEIRQELFRKGKTLTVLIEDITAASGVDNSLLDALLTDKIEYPDKKMCRLNVVVGSTDGYYREKFRSNTKGRIHNFVYVPDDLFSGNQNGLIEFFAKYLNTISLSTEDIRKWVEIGKADLNTYPVHTDTIGKGWGEYKYGGSIINLFPFTKNAILFLYEKQDTTRRNPRASMREIIEPYIKDAMEHLEEYPIRRPSFQASNTELQNAIYNNNTLDDATKIRLSFFMYIWETEPSVLLKETTRSISLAFLRAYTNSLACRSLKEIWWKIMVGKTSRLGTPEQSKTADRQSRHPLLRW